MSEVFVIYLPPVLMALPLQRTTPPRQHDGPVRVAVATRLSNEVLLSDTPTIIQDPSTGTIRKVVADSRDMEIILPDGTHTTVREVGERLDVEFISTASTNWSSVDTTLNENDADARFQIEGRIISLMELGEYCLENAIFLGVPLHNVRSALKAICDYMSAAMSSRQRPAWTDVRRVLDLMVAVRFGSGPGIAP
jgi:hypothetical protein